MGLKDANYPKDYWDVEEGVTYIPYAQLPPDFSALLEGGMADEETLPNKGQFHTILRIENVCLFPSLWSGAGLIVMNVQHALI